MGYSTKFQGVLKFTHEPSIPQIRVLREMEGVDSRNVGVKGAHWYYLDLVVTDELDGLQWNGAEKTGGMDEQVRYVIAEMRKQWPEFGLTGEMRAQGEEPGDRWVLKVDGDVVKRIETPPKGVKATCPSCAHTFYVE